MALILKLKSKLWYLRLGGLLFFLIVVFLSFGTVIDQDFGWHLGVGQYILETYKIPQKDLFSFTLPDYPYVYHSWLTDVLLYVIDSSFGLWGVSLFYSFFIGGGFWLLAKISQLKLKKDWSYFFLLFFVPLGVWVIGLRIQVITFFALTLVYYIFELADKKNSLLIWIIPPLFVLWANLHGGFVLGLLFLFLLTSHKILSVFSTSRSSFYKKKSARILLSIFFLSVVASLITPYGIRSFWQAYMMAANPFAAKLNLDWMPLFVPDTWTILLGGLLYVSVLLVVLSGKNVSWKEKFLILLFFFLSLKSKRFVLPLLIVLLPTLIFQIERFALSQSKEAFGRFPLYVSLIVACFSFFLKAVQTYAMTWRAYSSEEYYAKQLSSELHYPYAAVLFMKKHGYPERILNDFSWGGYLIWHFPNRKFFIDGRMDNFFINGESFAQQYWQLINLDPGWQNMLESYQIEAVLAPVQEQFNWPLVEALKLKSKWEVVFEDDVSILLELQKE